MLLRNSGGKFVDVSSHSGPVFLRPIAARGVAFGDFNNEGFVDIAINCNGEPAILLKNGRSKNHWLVVQTVGSVSNRDGIGASLRLVPESGPEQFGTVTTASSYRSASDKRVYFGLGSCTKVKLREITWSSGIVQQFTWFGADRILTAQAPKK